MHALAIKITDASIERKWIKPDDAPWCTYAIENKLMSAVVLISIFILALLLRAFLQAVIFICIFSGLRHRMGGWHAPYAWICIIASLCMVLAVILFAGPFVMQFPISAVWRIDIIVLTIALITKPVYPVQTHFNYDILCENNKRKNWFIIVLLLIQCVSNQRFPEFLVYGMLAVFMGIMSVYVESIHKFIQRRRISRENT